MKKIIIILVALATTPCLLMSQEEDTVVYEEVEYIHTTTPRNPATRWIILELGFSGVDVTNSKRLENGLDPFDLRFWKSTNVNIHLVQQRFNLIGGHLNLVYGLTFEFHKYYFDNPVRLLEDQPQATFEPIADDDIFKHRLNYSYLTVPVMLNIQTNPYNRERSGEISAGFFVGPRLSANFKTKSDDAKMKVKDNFNLNQWRYGLRAQVGYGPVLLYGTYSLSPLFEEEENNSYDVNPISFGLVVWPF